MAFTYRNTVQRPLSYAEHDGNLQEIELVYEQALAARDAAVLATAIFADTTQGLANTTDGEYFTVPSADAAGFLDLYINDDGTAEFVKQYPSTAAFGTAAAENVGTSGNAIGKLNTANTHVGGQIIDNGSSTGRALTILSSGAADGREIRMIHSSTSDAASFAMQAGTTVASIGAVAQDYTSVTIWQNRGRFDCSAGSGVAISCQGENPIVFGPNRVERMRLSGTGDLGIGTASPTALLDINGDTLRLRTSKTPASATATGNAGDIAWDADYIYVCIATNTWRRVAHATW